jgi:hypothetical protein
MRSANDRHSSTASVGNICGGVKDRLDGVGDYPRLDVCPKPPACSIQARRFETMPNTHWMHCTSTSGACRSNLDGDPRRRHRYFTSRGGGHSLSSVTESKVEVIQQFNPIYTASSTLFTTHSLTSNIRNQ